MVSGLATVQRLIELAGGLAQSYSMEEAAEWAAHAARFDQAASVAILRAKGEASLEHWVVAGPEAESLVKLPCAEPVGFVDWVRRTGALTISEEIASDGRTTCLRRAGLKSGSAVGLPVKGGDRLHAILLLVLPQPGPLSAEELGSLQAIADMLGIALEKKRLMERSEEQVRYLLALQEVSRLLTSTIDPEQVLSIIVDVVTSLFNLDLCCLLLDNRQGSLLARASRGLAEADLAGISLPADRAPDEERFRRMGYTCVAILPISGRSERLGFLVVGSRSSTELDEAERSPLLALISLAGIALENSRWMSESEGAQQEMAEAMVMILEAQRLVRPGLAQQRADLASAVATHLRLPERDVRDIHLAALLRDVYVMNPAASDSLKLASRRSQRVRLLLDTHEERWDGRGLQCLAADQIPLGARVLAVVNAFTSAIGAEGERRSTMATLRQVKGESAQRWDPRVVSALETVIWQRPSLLQSDPFAPEAEGEPSPEAPKAQPAADLSGLTNREAEILSLVAHGLTNREIAARLFLSEATVKTHVSRVLQKLGLPDRTKAAVYALLTGF